MTTRAGAWPVAADWKRSPPAAIETGGEPASDWDALQDAALIDACLAGRREAFDPIVRRYGPQVYRVCLRFAGNHADASDLAQDTFVRAFRGLRTFKGRSTVSTWLYRIAVNVCLNRASTRVAVTAALQGRDPVDVQGEAADARLLRAERAHRVRAAIARLPKKQRATLILRVYHDLGHDEIASILGSSAGTVKVNFFHALANLRKLLT